MKAPKVFISHASEDKQRFVVDFATALRKNGIDAWVDQWEIKLGDSLVDKIFEEGIKDMDIFVIVLSKHSIEKPWVREELNASVVKRISKNTKIIPVIIDADIEVPEVLKSTVWVQIKNLDDYASELKSILGAIFDIDEKPAIGSKPAFALPSIQISGLSKSDSLVLKMLGDIVFDNNEEHLSPDQIKIVEGQLELSTEQINESLEILENHYYVKLTQLMGSNFPLVKLTDNGIMIYSENIIEDFKELHFNIVHLIFNEKTWGSFELAKKLECKTILIDALLNRFELANYIKASHCMSGGIQINDLTALGKRYFREVLEGTK